MAEVKEDWFPTRQLRWLRDGSRATLQQLWYGEGGARWENVEIVDATLAGDDPDPTKLDPTHADNQVTQDRGSQSTSPAAHAANGPCGHDDKYQMLLIPTGHNGCLACHAEALLVLAQEVYLEPSELPRLHHRAAKLLGREPLITAEERGHITQLNPMTLVTLDGSGKTVMPDGTRPKLQEYSKRQPFQVD